MRLAVDCRALHAATGSAHRGIGHYLTESILALAAVTDFEFTLIGLRGRGYSDRMQPIVARSKVVEVDAVPPFERPKPWWLYVPRLRSMPSIRGRHYLHRSRVASEAACRAADDSGADVFWMPSAVDIGSQTLLSASTPTVGTFLDGIPLVVPAELYDRWEPGVQNYYQLQLDQMAKMARVIAISDASAEHLRSLRPMPPGHVVTVYPVVSDEFFAPVDPAREAAVRARFDLNQPFFLFNSVPDPHKNLGQVLAAFGRGQSDEFADSLLVLVCPDSPAVKAQIAEEAAKAGVPMERIRHTGRLDLEDLVVLYARAVALCSPSRIEGFGLPAAQALAAGTPAIVGDLYAQPEVVEDAGIVVDPNSPEAIAGAMSRIRSDSGLRETMARRGRERSERFRRERIGTELAAVLRAAKG